MRLAFFNPETGQYAVASSKEVSFAAQGESLLDDNGKPRSGASGGIAPLPTLPPLPFGPDLEYEEPTLLERLTAAVSLKSALLIASVLAGILLLLALSSRLRRAPPPEGLAAADLDRAHTMAELEAFLRRLAADRIPSLREDASLDEIRARVSAQVKDPEVLLAVRAVFDELELLRYGSPGRKEDLDGAAALRARVRPLLRLWQAGR